MFLKMNTLRKVRDEHIWEKCFPPHKKTHARGWRLNHKVIYLPPICWAPFLEQTSNETSLKYHFQTERIMLVPAPQVCLQDRSAPSPGVSVVLPQLQANTTRALDLLVVQKELSAPCPPCFSPCLGLCTGINLTPCRALSHRPCLCFFLPTKHRFYSCSNYLSQCT